MSATALAALATTALDPALLHLAQDERDRLDEFITLTEAATEMPRRRAGKKTHVITVHRWTTKGCRGVKLRYAMIGATRMTTRRWVAEFFEALTAQSRGDVTPPRTKAEITRASERAVAALTAAGI